MLTRMMTGRLTKMTQRLHPGKAPDDRFDAKLLGILTLDTRHDDKLSFHNPHFIAKPIKFENLCPRWQAFANISFIGSMFETAQFS